MTPNNKYLKKLKKKSIGTNWKFNEIVEINKDWH